MQKLCYKGCKGCFSSWQTELMMCNYLPAWFESMNHMWKATGSRHHGRLWEALVKVCLLCSRKHNIDTDPKNELRLGTIYQDRRPEEEISGGAYWVAGKCIDIAKTMGWNLGITIDIVGQVWACGLCAMDGRAREMLLVKTFGAQKILSPREWTLEFFYTARFWVCLDLVVTAFSFHLLGLGKHLVCFWFCTEVPGCGNVDATLSEGMLFSAYVSVCLSFFHCCPSHIFSTRTNYLQLSWLNGNLWEWELLFMINECFNFYKLNLSNKNTLNFSGLKTLCRQVFEIILGVVA